jgi:uncharacterized membrane protein YedE/YeeE
MTSTWFLASIGGAMMGAASTLLLASHGRIAGISGIAGSLLHARTRDRAWRLAFLGGLVAAGLVARVAAPSAIGASVQPLPIVIVAGFLVGFGARLGNGCTSGHGVCGLARLSARSLVAVATFMLTGALTVAVLRGVS